MQRGSQVGRRIVCSRGLRRPAMSARCRERPLCRSAAPLCRSAAASPIPERHGGRSLQRPHDKSRPASGRRPIANFGDRKARSPHSEAGFLTRLFPRERRYAELGCLLPSSIGPAVKTRCIGPSSWLASDFHYTRSRHLSYALNGWEDRFWPCGRRVQMKSPVCLIAGRREASYNEKVRDSFKEGSQP